MEKLKKVIIVGGAIASAVGGVILIKRSFEGDVFDESRKGYGKNIVLTGATSGIGESLAKEFGKRGAILHIGSRDKNKCEELREKIRHDYYNKEVYCYECDLASLESVKRFCDELKKKKMRIDSIINNGGIMFHPKTLTKDGYESHFHINYLTPYLIQRLLVEDVEKEFEENVKFIDPIKKKKFADYLNSFIGNNNNNNTNGDYLKKDLEENENVLRLINVTCSAMNYGRHSINPLTGANLDDLNFMETDYSPRLSYAQSKSLLRLLSLSYKNSSTTINSEKRKILSMSVHPGYTKGTGIMRGTQAGTSSIPTLIDIFSWLLWKKPETAASTILHCVLMPSTQLVDGGHYNNCELDREESNFTEKNWRELSREIDRLMRITDNWINRHSFIK
ncbi:hypothetical protein SNEBB_002035 [Seison nebaliae]|nr:hypothetical protein SNEBB_002035 [Seison nebaliae]